MRPTSTFLPPIFLVVLGLFEPAAAAAVSPPSRPQMDAAPERRPTATPPTAPAPTPSSNKGPSPGRQPAADAERTPAFDAWLETFRADARSRGISDETLRVLDGLQPIPRVIELDRRQPEGTLSFARYLRHILGGDRIQYGRRMMAEEAPLLTEVSERYGVPAHVLAALWGIESSYGRNTGGFPVVGALATLAWEGRRAAFFRSELLHALRILEEGHTTPAKMVGSWAGAMGQCQFMPSSFVRWAVDHDGDGRRDIWETRADIFASTANYLVKNGWKRGQRWGRRVELPDDLDPALVGLKVKKPLSEWDALGVRLPGGGRLPEVPMEASLIRPGGPKGPAYLVYDNFRVLLHWNRSLYFATAVGLLSDRLRAPATR